MQQLGNGGMAFVWLALEQTKGVCEAVPPASKRLVCWSHFRGAAVRFWRTAMLDWPFGGESDIPRDLHSV